MKIIVCGAGEVGRSIARRLSTEDNDITLIDNAPELIQRVGETLDVRAICGHASHPDVLEKAGAADADMLIAVTYSDEVNMVSCQVAHSLFNMPTKIARVRHQSYLNPLWKDLYRHDHLPIDHIISPEIEVARALTHRLRVPGAVEMVPFARERVQLIGVRCMPDCPVLGMPLSAVRHKIANIPVKIIGRAREERFELLRDEDELEVGDEVYFICEYKYVESAKVLFGHEEREAQRVIILGGGNIGLFLAQQLEETHYSTKVKILEISRERAEFVAERLSETTVINGSGLDTEILKEANVMATDAIIAVTNDDKVNILASLLAKRHGCQRAITLVSNSAYWPLVSTLGIDVIVSPQEITISSILQHIRRGRIRSVHAICNGAAEVIEAEAMETSMLAGRKVREMGLPHGAMLAAIVRKDQVIMPEPETVIQKHDHVIIVSAVGVVRKVERLFSVRLEYF